MNTPDFHLKYYIFVQLDERGEEREEEWALMQELALARAPKHFASM